jgi:hypothetical protein
VCGKIGDCLAVAVKAQTLDAQGAHGGNEGDAAKVLARVYVGKVHLGCGNANGCNGVGNGDACVGVGGRIDDDAVLFVNRVLNSVYDHALVIGLHDIDLNVLGSGCSLDVRAKRSVIALAVNIGLAAAQQIEIGSVNH